MSIRKSILIRVRLAFLMVVAFGAFILVRLIDIQVVNGEKWRGIAQENSLKFKKVNATRGSILSDDGSLLAASLPFYRVSLDPSISEEELFEKNVDTLSVLIADYFQDKTAEEYAEELRLARTEKRRYKIINRELVKYHDKKIMEEWPLFKEGRLKGGVIFEKMEKRFKPFDELARRTIGFVREDSTDQVRGVGLEYSFNSKLAGVNGEALYQKIPGGGWKPINDGNHIRPENGLDVHTSLDVYLQNYTTDVLDKALRRNYANYGCVIIMEVATGEIKAMVNLSKNSEGQYVEDYNYAIGSQGTTEPGSTFKAISMMALLEETKLSIEDTVNTGDGEYVYYDDCTMRDAAYYGYGKIPVKTVFEKSSNIGVSKLIFRYFREKPEKFFSYLDKFGMSEPLDFQMIGAGKPFFNRPGTQGWSGCSLPWMSIGYEIKLSPLQILTFYNGIANQGKMISPIIVKSISQGDEVIDEFESRVINDKMCSDRTLGIMQELLKGVVKRGTAREIRNDKFDIAGKTGTTQKIRNGQYTKRYYTSFAGYFPADNPKYSCIVVIDDPKGEGQYGGEVSAPVFAEIAEKLYIRGIEQSLPDTLINDGVFPMVRSGNYKDLKLLCDEMGIKQVDLNTTNWVKSATTGDTIQWVNNKIGEQKVPDVRGMTLKDALYVLENQGLKVKTRGRGRVQRQSLTPGQKARKGGVIYISLG
ncbi:penicillin-binding protein [Flammeovirgaceae bacterium SG7u.111]|nr:penicillin-binding protein [Flammeovirgaceae bacterium SG7u.132]WPO33805.1 penicillin-binding protein [Flammeovirgaceae bacterium SG7u.111]